MKCPECNAVFSDLRDLCPTCMLDIRDFKKSHGLKITYPTATYEDLLARASRMVFSSRPAKPEEAPPPVKAEEPKNGPGDIRSLFKEAFADTGLITESFELSRSQLGVQLNRDETILLFDLSLESLDEPERVERYVDEIATSESAKVEAEVLSKQLRQIEKVMDAPIFGLKGTKSHVSSIPTTKTAEALSSGPSYFTPSLKNRIGAIAVDGGIIVIGAAIFTALAVDLSTLNFGELLIFFRARLLLDFLTPISVFLEFFVMLLILYPLLFLGLLRTTVGLKLFGLKVIRDNGSRAGLDNITVRSFSAPLALFSLVQVLGYSKKRPWHEKISHTLTVQEKTAQSAA